jgi:hypothetical protein
MGYSVSSETVDFTFHWGTGLLGDAPKAVRAEKMLPIHAGLMTLIPLVSRLPCLEKAFRSRASAVREVCIIVASASYTEEQKVTPQN